MNTSLYGLIGFPLTHSFSRKYFLKKFATENIQAEYLNFEIRKLDNLNDIIASHPILKGLNVTIPYKESVISFLDKLNENAAEIGAVNTIKIENGLRVGYNTDYIGFQKSLIPLLTNDHTKALILGTGGASKAVIYALQQLGIEYLEVSRKPATHQISYDAIQADILQSYTLIINTTPIGMFPDVDVAPILPYKALGRNHILYDLIYNPKETKFLKLGKKQGCIVKNGLEMLELQAEAAWKIWQQ